MVKINKEEYEELKSLDEEWKWIARDSGGWSNEKLYSYLEKPYKDHNKKVWSTDDNTAFLVNNQLFQFIQWEDSEPWNIDELIEECESRKTDAKSKIEFKPWEFKPWFEDGEIYGGEYVRREINQLDDLRITEEQAYEKIAETFPATAKEIESVLEKYYSGILIEFHEELQESIMGAFDVETTSKTIEALTGMTLEQIAEEAVNGGVVPKQEEIERAYKDGYEKGKQHATEKQSEETETVASVFVDYFIASAKLKIALKMEVEELE